MFKTQKDETREFLEGEEKEKSLVSAALLFFTVAGKLKLPFTLFKPPLVLHQRIHCVLGLPLSRV